jgi:hypothetical protein
MDDRPLSKTWARSTRWPWIGSWLISLTCLLVLVAVWWRVYSGPPPRYPGEIVLITDEQASGFLRAHVPLPSAGEEAPMYIPTGVFIQAAQFKGPYTVKIAGYVWQRYADGLPRDLERGVVLPEAEQATFHEVYRTHQANEELIGWSFRATLREQFDYDRYPLDRQQLWLRMWHVAFERNAYLQPDLSAFPSSVPTALPGLDHNFVLENWQVQESYFSYRLNRYSTNFGIRDYDATEPQPELYYTIGLRRSLVRPLIARLLAPLVILVQLFVIVMVIGSDRARLELFDVKPGAVIFTCAAFFFVVLLAQNALREEVQSYGLVYLESVHILAYFVILGVALNSVLLVARPNARIFREYDNLWAEVAYWPMILVSLLAVTLLVFW